jgi:hypothetical protein
MKTEILKFVEERNPDRPVVGYVHVLVSDKMKLWFTVLKTKKGTYFCTPPSIKIDNDWEKVFAIMDESKMRQLCDKLKEELLVGGLINAIDS